MTLKFEWNYEDYLAVTNREDNKQSVNRWAEVVELINGDYTVDEKIRSAINFVDSEIL